MPAQPSTHIDVTHTISFLKSNKRREKERENPPPLYSEKGFLSSGIQIVGSPNKATDDLCELVTN